MTYKFFFPQSIDLDVLKEAHPPTFPFNTRHALWILDAVARSSLMGNGQLRRVFLQRIKNATKYMRWLEQVGVIEIDNRYLSGKFAKSYRFTDVYNTLYDYRTIESTIPPYHILCRTVSDTLPDSELNTDNSISIINTNKLYKSTLLPHNVGPQMYVDNPVNLTVMNGVSNQIRQDMATGKLTVDEANRAMMGLLDVQDEWSESVSKKCGRRTTPVTRMPKLSRKYLRIDGDADLSIVDIKSCIPFLMIRLFREEGVSAGELARWTDFVTAGDIYGAFAEIMAQTVNAWQEYTRDSAKIELLRAMFADNRGQLPSRLVFEAWFPEIGATLRRLRKGDHRILSHRMFQMESYVMLTLVGDALEASHIPAFSIYDAVLVRTKDAEYVRQLVQDTFTTFVGVPATATVEAV